jgi:phospholipid/cholesterol/gamma-HCH transport system substrate-binding protein
VKRAIKAHLRDFIAIVCLVALALVVAAYILQKERLRLPFIQSRPFTIYADLESAKAVSPGQGQAVRVSGVQIGLISGVQERDGYARVAMSIDPKYRGLIHTNWTALLRPRTGLDDMFIELQPQPGRAPVAKPGFTIPLANTQPPVDLDQIERQLDGDTRNYLDLLINGAGVGFSRNGGDQLAKILERFEPTHQDLARLNGAIAQRGRDLQQLVDSLARLNEALEQKQAQLVSLVRASNRVWEAFASQNQNVSRAVALLPGTLRQTTATLAQVQRFANLLGPTATNLLPAARALPAANVALRQLAVPATPILRSQIRPFVVAARPVVRNLEPASIHLAAATPPIRRVFTVLNHFVNLLGYNPGDKIHGYLWWLAWVDHNARTLFSNQDANGDFRNLFIQLSCDSIEQIVQGSPLQAVIYDLVPIVMDAGLCPKQASANAASLAQGKLEQQLARIASLAAGSPLSATAGQASSTRSRSRP